MKSKAIALAFCCVLLCGCPVKRVDDAGGDHQTPESAAAEMGVRVFAARVADHMEEVDDFSREADVQTAASEATRKAAYEAFAPLNERMQEIDPWDPVEGERVWREFIKGLRKAAAK